MKKGSEKISILPPRHGYISELAKLCQCNRKTVTRALFYGQKGFKADKVREFYKLYYEQHTDQEK